ncbi:cytochrome P450 4C1-like isoform X1 [Anabrus simplex]|uniref:cytochrome P450 4C1-like isoform X1 n=1 Tax=Anabrus simplex TaxID=316456 RepID=UPI0035A310CB
MGDVWKAGYSIAIFLLSCVFVFKFWWSRRRLRQLGNKIPGPPTLPLLGNIIQCLGGPRQMFVLFHQQWSQNEGRCFKLWIGPLLYAIVTSPEDAEQVLVKTRVLNRDRYTMKVLSRFIGNGLVTCTSQTWKKQRRVIAPSMQYKILDSYIPVFNKQSRILVDKLKKFADGNTFNLMSPLVAFTGYTISETAIGAPMNTDFEEDSIADIIRRAIHMISQRALKPWLLVDAFYDLTAMGKEQKKVEEILHKAGNSLLSSKLEEYREMKSSGSITDKWMKKADSIIDNFLRSSETEGAELDEQLLKDEVCTALIAGTDTTATTLCFTLLLLALHPTIQTAVFEELKEVFADDWERDVRSEDVKEMKYLSRVIKETMRLFPVVEIIPRDVDEDIELKTCTLPAGSSCMIINYFVHRDPRYFPDPERFDPDRFLPERSIDRHPYSYIPFGAGPRICVGFKYAEMVMPIVLATVLRKYRVLPVVPYEDLQKLEVGVFLRPETEFLIKMLPRKGTQFQTTDTAGRK